MTRMMREKAEHEQEGQVQALAFALGDDVQSHHHRHHRPLPCSIVSPWLQSCSSK